MTAVCKTKYSISAARSGRPPRAAYVNLYNWTDSENEIVKSAIQKSSRRVPVVDGVSCRQLYLRSYKFSTKESVPEKTRRCLGKMKEKLGQRKRRRSEEKRNLNLNRNRKRKRKRKCLIWKKMKEFSCRFILFGIFRRILSCAASIDVVEQSSRRNGN